MLNLLTLPRASWKVRLGFFVWSLLVISLMLEQWPHLHDGLAIARWIACFTMVGCVVYLPSLLGVVLFGRMPVLYQRMFKGLNRTLPQIHADFMHERRERHERSRGL